MITAVGRQNELVQSLRKQLEATEKELADQKWLLERYLESPSWRITAPIRWAAGKVRGLKEWIRRGKGDELIDQHHPGGSRLSSSSEEGSFVGVSPELKELFTATCRARLEHFLKAGSPLQVPHSDNPEISIVLVLFNRAELTLQCLRSIAEQGFERLEVIIVDNASADDTSRMLKLVEGARIIRNTENRNFLLGVNQGAEQARGEYLLILNNDTQLLPGTLHSALNTIRSGTDIGAVGGRLILVDWTLQEAGSIVFRDGSCLGYGRGDDPFAPMYMFPRDVDYCSAAFLLTPLATWRRLGGFNEAFRPAYYEDSDYCARLWEHGLRVVYDPYAALLHYEFASSTKTVDAIDLQRDHQEVFTSRHEKWLSERCIRGPEAILPARMSQNRRRILFIEDRVPHPWLGSGFPRARNMVLSLLKQGFFVTFYPMAHFKEPWNSVYSDMPHEIEFMMDYGPQLLETFLRSRHDYYDAVFVSRPHNMKTLQPTLSNYPEWFQNVTLIYDAEALFAEREIAFWKLQGSPLAEEEAQETLQQEIALAGLAEIVISVSESDAKQFETHGMNTVRVLGHSVAPNPTPRPFSERRGFIFVGAIHEEASPNADSVIWLLEEIFPRIREKLGDTIPLTIVGVNTSERVRQLAAPPARITGSVPDLTEFYDSARVFVAPTRYSAGIPQKIHDAAARGLPVVATPLLASQLGWQEGSPLLIAGDAEEFAAKCVQLHTDEALWSRLREAGIERIRKECSPELFENRLQSIMQNGHRSDARRYA
jgi:O-antigen biosynthesis protein